MSKPIILFIPGSFLTPELYAPVFAAVRARGHEIRGLHLPSVGLTTGPREGEPPTMYQDAAFIAAETEKLAEEGREVVLVAHSYGGVPTTESTKGLTKGERAKEGKKGGIVRLAYLTALVPAVGVNAGSMLGDVPPESILEISVDEKGWMQHQDIASVARIAFSDLSEEEGASWARRMVRHSAVSFSNELTHPGYKDVPVSYLLCEKDVCIPPSYQRKWIDFIEEVSGNKVDVSTIDAGHAPTAGEKIGEVVDWIVSVAEKA